MSSHQVHHTPSTAYTEYTIHQVQHTRSTAHPEYSILGLYDTPGTTYPEWSIHRVHHTLKIVCLPIMLTITSWPPNVASDSGMPPNMIDYPPPAGHQCSMVKSPRHISTIASQLIDCQSLSTRCTIHQLPPSTHRSSINHVLQSLSPNSLDYGLQVRTVMASMYIIKLARSRPPSVSTTVPIGGFKFALSGPWSAYPKSVYHNLGVHH